MHLLKDYLFMFVNHLLLMMLVYLLIDSLNYYYYLVQILHKFLMLISILIKYHNQYLQFQQNYIFLTIIIYLYLQYYQHSIMKRQYSHQQFILFKYLIHLIITLESMMFIINLYYLQLLSQHRFMLLYKLLINQISKATMNPFEAKYNSKHQFILLYKYQQDLFKLLLSKLIVLHLLLLKQLQKL